MIESYTRESGVRELNRQVAALMRKIAKLVATNEEYNVELTLDDIKKYLGVPRYSRDKYQGNDYAGVVTGLAWTQVGGEILFVESSLSKSKSPRLTLTGNLGDVMKESAMLALEYIKSHAEKLEIDPLLFDEWNVHVHVPEGAIPKDGPSAGVTMFTAMVSIFTNRKVNSNFAMTGEITLRGKVTAVGGLLNLLGVPIVQVETYCSIQVITHYCLGNRVVAFDPEKTEYTQTKKTFAFLFF
jgi:ATP-dependent Lon protease